MKTKLFLLVCLFLGIGITQLYSQKTSKQEEFTNMGEPAPSWDMMNGKVQNVVFKLYWGNVTGNNILKGNHISTRERDSLGWFYDFEASFDNIGDHIINYNTLDDNNNPVDKYQFIRENNKIVQSKWTFGKPPRMAFGKYPVKDGITKFIYNEEGLLIKKEDCVASNDSLIYSFALQYNVAGDEIETQAFDGKGTFLRKWTKEYNEKRQFVAGVNYDKDKNILNSYKYTLNDKGKISEVTSYDKNNNVAGTANYYYYENDARGNWTKIGFKYGPYTTFAERTITYFK